MLGKTLEARGYSVEESADAYEARRKIQASRFLVVLTDLRLPAGSGFDVLQASKEADAQAPVIVMTAFGTVDDAVRAMKEGATDFLTKPVDTEHLLLVLERAMERQRLQTKYVLLKEEHQRRFGLPKMMGEDPALKETMLAIQRVAATDATVLVLGESGTGKELMSRALHQLSARAKGPFVAINCAAIPENLLENELFGHEKGAFTGATGRTIGRARMAAALRLSKARPPRACLARQRSRAAELPGAGGNPVRRRRHPARAPAAGKHRRQRTDPGRRDGPDRPFGRGHRAGGGARRAG